MALVVAPRVGGGGFSYASPVTYPLVPPPGDSGPAGWSYAGAVVRTTREALLPLLAELRVTGFCGPDEDGWVVVVAAEPGGVVAGDRRDLFATAAEVAVRLGTAVLAAEVTGDRLLVLQMWDGDRDLGRYVSDPSALAPDDEDVFGEPEGAWHARDYAGACGRGGDHEVVSQLEERLAEWLDPESVFESERLAAVLGLLGLPTWLVSARSLPRDVPAGPRAADVTRLGSGRTGLGGRLVGGVTGVVRRRRGRRTR